MIRRDVLKTMCCSPLLGLLKVDNNIEKKYKKITTVILEVLEVSYKGSVAYVVIEDICDAPENQMMKVNRAWHVYDREAFFAPPFPETLPNHPSPAQECRSTKITKTNKFPQNVQRSIDMFNTLEKYHQFHCFWQQPPRRVL